MDEGASVLGDIFWYFLLTICHLLWGLFPVSCRYLQTKAKPPLPSMRLGFYVAALAAVGLFFTYTVPIWLYKCCQRQASKRAGGQVISGFIITREPMLHSILQLIPRESHVPLLMLILALQEKQPVKTVSLLEKITAILVLAISLGVLAFGGILAADYTSANWLQLLYMTAPLLVALLARAVLKIPIEPALWPSLVLTLVGSGTLSLYNQSSAIGTSIKE